MYRDIMKYLHENKILKMLAINMILIRILLNLLYRQNYIIIVISSFLIITVYLLEDKKYIIIIGLINLCLMSYALIDYSFNYEGHDYNIYVDKFNRNIFDDLPISYLLMNLAIIFFGNPEGLMILSLILSILICIIFQCKFYDESRYFLFALTPIIILGNQGLKYLVGGVLRNIIGLYFITGAIVFEFTSFIIIVLLVSSHIPSFIYYLMINIFNLKKKVDIFIYAGLMYIFMLCIGLVFKGEILQSICKPIEILITKLIYYWYVNIPNFHGWNKYMIIVSSIIIMSLIKYSNIKDKKFLNYLFPLLILYFPLFNWKIMLRLVYMSFIPILMLLYICEVDIDEKIYLVLISIDSLTSVLP